MTMSPHPPVRPPVLLVSGAGLPAWVWDGTRAALADTHASTVAARPTPVSTARLPDYVEAAVAAAPPGRFAVVAHSSGGLVGAEVARLLPDRVVALLAVCAVVPGPGGSFLSAMPAPQRWVLRAAMRVAGTRPPDSAVRRGLAAGLDRTATERLLTDLTAESARLYRDGTTRAPLPVRRGYVRTSRDRELPTPLQERFAERLDASWCADLDTGHLPMLERPDATADTIRRFLAA
ncbi:alpha/beta fold hydrolase [Actinotalea sp. Marseille-Q4924]|uniref:alpha/beta fold hydrolase n=1 Tax=Actinotalea sp. Marseille-Q4924 TaxID=2866571 RepID=UPI001CE4550E|nr:alpha/beta hydrolase [Actinotalea sp. Marseille-Q4924]